MEISAADIWAFVLMLAGGLLLWRLAYQVAEPPDRRFLSTVVATTFALRVAWSATQHLLFPQVWLALAADAIARYNWAVRDAWLWQQGLWQPHWPQSLAEAHRLAVDLKTTILVYLFGPSPMLPEAFVITLNTTTVIALYLICRQIGAVRQATRTATLLVAFLPSLIFWSTQDLKDPFTAACAAWATLALLRLGTGFRLASLGLLGAANLFALVYRPYVGILLLVGQGLAVAATMQLPATPLGKFTRLLLFALLAPLVIQFGIQEMKETYGEKMGLEWAIESYMEFREKAEAEGVKGSEYEIPLEASTPREALLQLPLRIFFLLFSPIPIFRGTFRRMMTYPEMWFLYLFVLPRFVWGFREAWRKNRPALFTLLLIVGPIIIAYALKTALSGEAYRVRTQFMPLLLILAGVGHAVRQEARATRQRREAGDRGQPVLA